MKRILIFSLVYYPRHIGGAEVAVKEITDRISPAEIAFDMVTLHAASGASEKIANSTIYRAVPGFISLVVAKYLYLIAAFWKALWLHRKYRYDAVWSIMANYAGASALFFKLFHPKVPFILTLQEGDPIDYIERRVGIFYPLWRMIFTKADKVQAISNYLANWARETGARAPVVIPNGVDLRRFRLLGSSFQEREGVREELDFGKDDTVLVTVSRLVEKNAVGDIIEALQHLPENVKLLIVGAGSLEGSLKLKARSLNLKARICFVGFISHEELPKYLWASDIFVRPSRSEGMGNSFIEAMAAGLPVIATSVGGIPDFLKDGETGLFCEVGNPKSIAQKVEKLMKDSESRKYIVENALKMVREKYDWDLVAERMKTEIFNAVIC